MRAFKTRYLIDLLVGTIENSENPRSDMSSLKSHILESDNEIVELERLAEIGRASENKPIKVTKSPYNIAFCPKCKGSVWQNKDESKFCFRCGQMISW